MLIKLAQLIYRFTPFRSLRQFLFDSYARSVKNSQRIASVDGVRYRLDLGELIDLALYLGKFEPSVVAAIERDCRPGMTVLDIGANVGAHALRFARIVGRTGHVYAFEPTLFAYAKLQQNVELNPQLNISTFRIALSDSPKLRQSIAFRASWRTDGSQQDAACEVDFVRLDDWAAQHGVADVDLIKLDVDGNEFPILAGGMDLLSRCRPVLLMEMVGPHFAQPARNPFSLLASLGYSFSNVDSGVRYSSVVEMSGLIASDDVGMTTSINILATPPARIDGDISAERTQAPLPSVMAGDRESWARQLHLSNFVNSYYQYRDVQLCGGQVKSILIVGPGQGLDTQIFKWRGYKVTTFDIDDTFAPDKTGSVHDLSMFADGSFDVVIASHVLEHVPVAYFESSLREMARVGRYSLVYLPVAGRHFQFRLKLDVRNIDLSSIMDLFNYLDRPDGITRKYCSGQHYWEVGMRGFRVSDLVSRFSRHFDLIEHYRNRDWNPSYNFVMRSKTAREDHLLV
jgi:FkbM family methyltransferase